MALLTVVNIDNDGVDPATGLVAAAAGGDTFRRAGGMFVMARNTDSSTAEITVNAPVSTSGSKYGNLPVSDLVITVPITSGERVFFVPSGYANQGVISMSYDSVTALTIGVFSVG